MNSCASQPKAEKSVIIAVPKSYFPAPPDLPYETYKNIYDDEGNIIEKRIPFDAWKQIAIYIFDTEEAIDALYDTNE